MPTSIRHDWQTEEVLELMQLPLMVLLEKAHTVHREYFNPNKVQLSTILNIKEGGCPEDCKFCSQSKHYQTLADDTGFLQPDDVLAKAKIAKANGATRFCMVAAWRQLRDRDMQQVSEMIKAVNNMGMETCMSLGFVNDKQVQQLEDAGLDYYNHNLETSREHYEKVVGTHTFQHRYDTVARIQQSKIRACCGGIIGMSENKYDRASLLMELANMAEHPPSVPINILVRIEGTPMAENKVLDPMDHLRMVATARILMPASFVRLSAGRKEIGEGYQLLCYYAGANSIHYGEKLLTTPGFTVDEDKELFERAGIEPMQFEDTYVGQAGA